MTPVTLPKVALRVNRWTMMNQVTQLMLKVKVKEMKSLVPVDKVMIMKKEI